MRQTITEIDQLRRIHADGDGFVHNPFDKRLHRASCAHVGRMGVGTNKWFYASYEEALRDLAAHHARYGGEWKPCPSCAPDRSTTVRSMPPATTSAATEPSVTATPAVRADRRRVEVETPAYIPFEPRTAELKALRAQLRSALRGLHASDAEVLHAVLHGPLPAGVDVENALLYNIDAGGAFRASTAGGVRFELAPGSGGYRYDYSLQPRDSGWLHWQEARSLAEWRDIPLAQPLTVASLWHTLRRHPLRATADPAVGRPFAVSVTLRGQPASAMPLVKPLVDGVVCALQRQRDHGRLAEPAARLARQLAVPVADIEALLTDPTDAVLGVVDRLVWPWRDSVQWNPGDDLCRAGDVLLEHPRGLPACDVRVIEIEPRPADRRH